MALQGGTRPALYDRLLFAALTTPSKAEDYERELNRQFEAFPDDYATLWAKGLAHFRYRPTADGVRRSGGPQAALSIESLLADGRLSIEPILYEDFLPASAAGIFRSNLADRAEAEYMGRANRQNFEDALGCAVTDPQSLYSAVEADLLAALKLQGSGPASSVAAKN